MQGRKRETERPTATFGQCDVSRQVWRDSGQTSTPGRLQRYVLTNAHWGKGPAEGKGVSWGENSSSG